MKNIGKITRWTVAGIFCIFAIANGFKFSSLFILVAAFLMMPIIKTENKKTKILIITLSIILLITGIALSPAKNENDSEKDSSVISTTEEDINSAADEKQNSSIDSVISQNESSVDTSHQAESNPSSSSSTSGDKKPTVSKKPTSSQSSEGSSDDESISSSESSEVSSNTSSNTSSVTSKPSSSKMVWVTASGKKYHSIPNCGSSKTSRQIPLEDAKKRYEKCSKCW